MNRLGSWLCKTFFKPPVDKYLIKEVRGLENKPKGNFILAANHQSHLDQVATGYVCVPRKYHYIGQTDRYSGFPRLIMYFLYFFAGVIPVNRKDKNSREKAVKKAVQALKNGACLVIYPEGTRSRTGQLQEGKFGVAKLFLKTGVPILPAGIKGTSELMPVGKAWPEFKKIIEIKVGKPLFFEEEFSRAKNLPEESTEYQLITEKITDKVMEEITNLIK
jgi:1-acyl-sn-glycerol-3-phosphate acyltransferase